MPWYLDLAIILVVCAIIALLIVRLRKHLLKLWKEVSSKEVIFNRQLEHVAKIFYEHRELLRTDENKDLCKIITRYRNKKIRNLLLSTRQGLFQAINIVFEDMEEVENEAIMILKKEFSELQKVRRVYNSSVLIYNQTISVFPTRYLALRMNLELKEYFG